MAAGFHGIIGLTVGWKGTAPVPVPTSTVISRAPSTTVVPIRRGLSDTAAGIRRSPSSTDSPIRRH